MKTYARIAENGIVAEVIETERDISTMFHPDLKWVVCPLGTPVGSTYANGAFSQPDAQVESAAMANAGILSQIAAIELSQGRAIREAALGVPDATERLRAIDAEIAALRSRLK